MNILPTIKFVLKFMIQCWDFEQIDLGLFEVDKLDLQFSPIWILIL